MNAGEFDLSGMLSVLEAEAREIRAKRIVFDGIDVLLSLLDDPTAERRELYRIRDWLERTGLTAVITQKVGTHVDQEAPKEAPSRSATTICSSWSTALWFFGTR